MCGIGSFRRAMSSVSMIWVVRPFRRERPTSIETLALDEALRGAIRGIDEDNILRVASRSVDRQHDEGFLKQLRGAVNRALFEENELAGAGFEGWRFAQEKCRAAADHQKVLIAG